MLESLEAAVTFAPNPLAAVREARAWREMIAPAGGQVRKGLGEPLLLRCARIPVDSYPLGAKELMLVQ